MVPEGLVSELGGGHDSAGSMPAEVALDVGPGAQDRRPGAADLAGDGHAATAIAAVAVLPPPRPPQLSRKSELQPVLVNIK
jgi:hypothetical protein